MAYVRSESVLGLCRAEGVKQLPVEPVPPLRAGFGDLANGNLSGFWRVAFHALTGIVSVEHGHDSALNIAVFVD